jgi:hypothetical protein
VHLIGPVSLRPSKPLGLTHPILQIAGADNLSAWQTMPPLDGANRFRRQSIKAAASVLAETPEGDPLLLSTMYGDGRVLAFAGDSTWRWRMAGRMDEHLRFWRQTVFFLAKKDIDDSDVWIRLAGRRFDPGRAVHFTAGARTKDGRPRDDAVLTAAVTKSDGATSVVRLVRQGDAMAGTILDTLAPGDYRVTVSAQAGGQTLEPASARFIIDEQDYELDAAQGDPSLLRNLAELTAAHDGRFVYPEEFPALIESLQAKPKELQVEVQSRWTFGQQSPDAFAALFVVVALLGVEWFLRKKWGLA